MLPIDCTSERNSWLSMKARCCSPSSSNYSYYGARGITVCARWVCSFEAFYEDMGPKPTRLHSIERRDNNKGYEPGNCFWATKQEQARNRRNKVVMNVGGVDVPLIEIADRTGLSYQALHHRLLRGWSYQRMISQPVMQKTMRPREHKDYL